MNFNVTARAVVAFPVAFRRYSSPATGESNVCERIFRLIPDKSVSLMFKLKSLTTAPLNAKNLCNNNNSAWKPHTNLKWLQQNVSTVGKFWAAVVRYIYISDRLTWLEMFGKSQFSTILTRNCFISEQHDEVVMLRFPRK